MTGYTKLFGSIITSTIWREDKETKILWITMLALKDKNGIVEGSVPGLADMARLTLEETEASLKKLRGPDPHSRTKDHDGRRIEDVDGGWLILNHDKWRQKMNEDERREYNRIKQAEHRAKFKMSKPVSKRKQMSALSAHTDADTDTKKEEGAKGSRPTSDDWLKSLEMDQTYSGINVRQEYGKMLNWCKVHAKQPTQRRFVNWLNRTDRPITDNGEKPVFERPKERAPSYEKITPPRDLTPEEEAEAERARAIAKQETEALRAKLKLA